MSRAKPLIRKQFPPRVTLWRSTQLMPAADSKPRGYRFAAFELDLTTGELRKTGMRIKLQDQPLPVVALLLARKGGLVTGGGVRNRLWRARTFVGCYRVLERRATRL